MINLEPVAKVRQMEAVRRAHTFLECGQAYFALAASVGAGIFDLTESQWIEMQAHVLGKAPMNAEGQLVLPVD